MSQRNIRNHLLDKTSFPKNGYFWIPATSDTSTVWTQASHRRNTKPVELGFRATELEGQQNKLYEYGTPNITSAWTTSRHPVLDEAGYTKVTHLGYDFFQASRFALYGAPDAPKNKTSAIRTAVRKRAYVLQDSGGFQLATGTEDFIDPKDVIWAHNRDADAGVALDIPSMGMSDPVLLRRTAKVLVANNEVLMKHRELPVKLVNVCHGRTLELRADYIRTLRTGPMLDALCIGGLRKSGVQQAQDPVDFASHVMLSILMTQKVYHHYHVLGVASPWQMALLSLIAEVTDKVVTSDSASHHLSAKSGLIIDYKGESNHRIGRDLDDFDHAACCCPVCSVVQHQYPLKVAAPIASLHNGYALLRRAAHFRQAAKRPQKEADALLLLTSVHPNPVQMKRSIHLVRTVTKPSQLQDAVNNSARTSLFGASAAHAVNTNSDRRAAFLIKQYEKYHGRSF